MGETMIRKRNKKNRLRGQRTHGRGNTKNARGKGTKGGQGKAGSHKHLFSKYWQKFGKKGFKPKRRIVFEEINLDDLNECINAFKRKEPSRLSECFSEENGLVVIDLKERNFKVLGNGSIEGKIILKNASLSKKAKEAIEKVGGRVE